MAAMIENDVILLWIATMLSELEECDYASLYNLKDGHRINVIDF